MEDSLKDTVNNRFVQSGQQLPQSAPIERMIKKLGWFQFQL
jgi:hypothetical protein